MQQIGVNSFYLFLIPSFFVGCLAFRTQNIGQILGYTTVSNLSYIVSGLLIGSETTIRYSFIYFFVYFFQLVALFLIFIVLYKKYKFSNVNQLFLIYYYNKFFFYSLLLLFFSLAGIPPLAGFFTKYFLFIQIYNEGFFLIAFFGLVSSFLMSIIYLQITLQLILVKRDVSYYELSKNSNFYSYNYFALRLISVFICFIFLLQIVNIFFFFFLPFLSPVDLCLNAFIFLVQFF